MSTQTLIELQEYETSLKKALEIGEDLNKLLENKLFKKVILERYMKDEAIRLVHLKSDPQWQSDERQAYIDKCISAIGGLNSYFVFIQQEHEKLKQALVATQQEIAELINEGDVE